jgi:two-component system sensor histidine kinase YesM
MKNRYNNLSISQKLSLLFMALILITIVVTGYFSLSTANKTMNTIIEDSSKEINKQIILNYENYIDGIQNHAQYIESITKTISPDNPQILRDLYRDYAQSNIDIVSVSLVSDDGDIIATNLTYFIPNPEIKQLEWFNGSVENEGTYYFTPPHVEDVTLSGENTVISISKHIKYHLNGVEQEGVLVIDVTDDKIKQLAKQTNLGEFGHMIIISDDDQLVFSTSSDCYSGNCESLNWVQNTIIGADYIKIGNNNFYANINTIHGTRWRIATFVDVNIVETTRVNMFVTILGILALTTITSVILVSFLARQITLPLNKLTEHMKAMDNEHHLHTKIEVTGQKEVVILTKAYNRMIEEIRELMIRLVEEQKEKRKSEFLALQTQINPHFLYNTLDSIVWLSEQSKNEEVTKMVLSLSRFFRVSISRGKNVIPIEKEIQHAQSYLIIQAIRYSNKFRYTFDISEEVYRYSVVKLILQPIIENAINHGLNDEEQGLISVRAYKKDDKIYFEIENDGYGLTTDQINNIYRIIQSDSNESFGLRNVYQRLKLYYGTQSDLTVQSVLDESTVFIISIPAQEVKE